jgi:hypothetical protein
MTRRWLLLSAFFLSLAAHSASVTLEFPDQQGAFLTAPYYENGVRMKTLSGHYDLFGGSLNIDPLTPEGDTYAISQVRFDMYGAWFDPAILSVSSPGGALKSSKGGTLQLSAPGTYRPSGTQWQNIEWVDFVVDTPSTGQSPSFSTIDSLTLGFEQGIILDFRSAPTRGIEIKSLKTKEGTRNAFVWSSDPTALGRSPTPFNATQIDTITSQVRDIFNQSGVPVPVFAMTSEFEHATFDLPRTALATVRFGSAVPGLLGKAAAVDQFNRIAHDEVAIFVPANDSRIATVIAHEVGHVLGVRHVNPKSTSNEVEDYAFGSTERFTDSVSPVREKPVNGNTANRVFPDGVVITQNPTYHIKKFALGATEDLGVPGTFDTRAIRTVKAQFEVDLDDGFELATFIVIASDGTEFSDDTFGEIFSGSANGKVMFSWEGSEGDEVEIFGQINGTSDYAVSVVFDDARVFRLGNVSKTASLQLYDVDLDSYRIIGAATISGEFVAGIPEPSVVVLTLSGFLLLGLRQAVLTKRCYRLTSLRGLQQRL